MVRIQRCLRGVPNSRARLATSFDESLGFCILPSLQAVVTTIVLSIRTHRRPAVRWKDNTILRTHSKSQLLHKNLKFLLRSCTLFEPPPVATSRSTSREPPPSSSSESPRLPPLARIKSPFIPKTSTSTLHFWQKHLRQYGHRMHFCCAIGGTSKSASPHRGRGQIIPSSRSVNFSKENLAYFSHVSADNMLKQQKSCNKASHFTARPPLDVL